MSRDRQIVPPRVHIEFAAASPIAAILRRGPSDWVRLLAWDTRTDAVAAGAWFHGRIYDDGCSLSPNGKLFAYFAAKHSAHNTRGVNYAWTAVSKLPWLTALALWPRSDAWGGRAQFADDQTLIVESPHWEPLGACDRLPEGFTVLNRWIGAGAPPQNLPSVPKASASFDGSHGVDASGRPFSYVDGILFRESHVIVDLQGMRPEPARPPHEASQW